MQDQPSSVQPFRGTLQPHLNHSGAIQCANVAAAIGGLKRHKDISKDLCHPLAEAPFSFAATFFLASLAWMVSLICSSQLRPQFLLVSPLQGRAESPTVQNSYSSKAPPPYYQLLPLIVFSHQLEAKGNN